MNAGMAEPAGATPGGRAGRAGRTGVQQPGYGGGRTPEWTARPGRANRRAAARIWRRMNAGMAGAARRVGPGGSARRGPGAPLTPGPSPSVVICSGGSAPPGPALDEDPVVDQETADDVAVDDRLFAGVAGLLHELVDGVVEGDPLLGRDGRVAVLGGPQGMSGDLAGRAAEVVAEVGHQRQAVGLLFRRQLVEMRALEPADDGGLVPDVGCGHHSGRPKRWASARTSARRFSASTGSWISPSCFSRSVTSGISSHGVWALPTKHCVDSGRRGRWPPVSGSSAG